MGALREAGRGGESGEILLRIVMAKPEHAEAHRLLGNWFRDHGDLEEAADEYERALAADPSHTASLFALGCVRIRLGEPERVREVRTRLAPLSAHLAAMLDRFAEEARTAAGTREPDSRPEWHREAAT